MPQATKSESDKLFPPLVDRDEMIETIVGDMERWLKSDAAGFWQHVKSLERKDLRKRKVTEIQDLYNDLK